MKKRLLQSIAIGATALMGVGVTGCQDFDPEFPVKPYDEMINEGLWDFSMTSGVNINLDLGLRGVTYPVSVYAEYPFDEDGELKDGVEPVFAFFTKDGRYDAKVELPQVCQKLYFACGGVGVPTLIEGRVINGSVEFDEALTRANTNVDLYNYNITKSSTTLTPTNYTYAKCSEATFDRFGNIATQDPTFASTLFSLYPWAVNGAPLAGTDDVTTNDGGVVAGPAAGTSGYHYVYYNSDASTVVSTNNSTDAEWLTISGLGTPQIYQKDDPIQVHDYYYLQRNDKSLFSFTALEAGELTIVIDPVDDASNLPKINVISPKPSDPSKNDTKGYTYAQNEESYTWDIGYAATYTVERSSKEPHVRSVKFVTETKTYEMVIDNADANSITNTDNFFTITGTIKEQTHTENNYTDLFCTYNDQKYYYGMDMNTNTVLKLTVPAKTIADLTLAYQDGTNPAFKYAQTEPTNTSKSLKDDGVVDHRTVRLTEGEWTITGNSTRVLYYVALDWVEDVSVTTTTYTRSSEVYKYKNVKDEMSTLYQDITNTLWHGYGSKSLAKSGGSSNSDDKNKYPYFNSEYAQADQSKNNITTLEDGSEVYVTFLAEFNSYSANSVGYYYYKKGEAPSNPDALKKYLMFPNCSSNLYSTAVKYKNHKDLTPLRTGDQVQLMYYDEATSQYTTEFPKDIVIGWFLIYSGFNGWDVKNDKADNMLDGTINLGVYNNGIQAARSSDYKNYLSQVYYSDPNFNNSGIARVIQFTEDENTIALCFEDSYNGYQTAETTRVYDDLTYDDVILAVSSNKRLHNNSDQDIVKQINGQISYAENGTYLFEDILDGNATDFDMNDVVIEYNRQYTLNVPGESVNGEGYTAPAYLTKTVETYKVINDGATYQDAFVVKTPYTTDNVSSVVVTAYKADGTSFYTTTWNSFTAGENKFTQDQKGANQQPSYELGSDGKISFVLFDDVNYIDMNVSYKFEITFKANYCPNGAQGSVTDAGVATLTTANPVSRSMYDPFIVVRDHPDSDGKRCEIHTPGKACTSYGKAVTTMETYTLNNYWYVAKFDNKCLPFALDITATGFKVCQNTVAINSVYPKFDSWAASNKENGTADADWYMSPGSGVATSYPTDR